MDATSVNTIVGIIGSIVGVIGIVVGIIGLRCINAAQEIRNTVKTGKGSTVTQTIQNGASISEVIEAVSNVTDQKMMPYMNSLNNLEDVQNILVENSGYSIPVIWSGSHVDYDLMVKENKTHPSVIYMIND